MSEQTPTVGGMKISDTGVTIVNPATAIDFNGAGESTTNPSPGKASVAITGSGSTGTIVTGESPTDNGNGTYTLAHTPIAGSVTVYKNGQRLNVGAGNDYTISGAVITRLDAYNASDVVLTDYRY